ncbi:telomere stability and silencing-domain-containing protein [Syncephalis fuscata]|nr:telomere stability and silencing-domain-containing protein [Syncephalis fuscata]
MISAIVSQVNRPSVVIDLESDGLTMSEVQSRLVAATGIPMDMQRLTTAGGLVCSSVDMPLSALCPVGNANSHERIIYLSLSMRMGGGKGGFGSELRKMGARLAARKATNFDSCRDLNGRRLKTVKRAKALANYMEGEEDRQQQKKDKIKKKIAKYNKEPLNKKHRFDDTAYFEDNERIQEDVRLAVQQAIQQEEVKDDVQTALADKTNDTGSPISSSSSSSSALDKGKGPAVSAFAMW